MLFLLFPFRSFSGVYLERKGTSLSKEVFPPKKVPYEPRVRQKPRAKSSLPCHPCQWNRVFFMMFQVRKRTKMLRFRRRKLYFKKSRHFFRGGYYEPPVGFITPLIGFLTVLCPANASPRNCLSAVALPTTGWATWFSLCRKIPSAYTPEN